MANLVLFTRIEVFSEVAKDPYFEESGTVLEEEKEFMDYLRMNDPEAFERLKDLRGRKPGLYFKAVRRGIREKHLMKRLKKENPIRYERKKEIYKLRKKVRRLSREYKETTLPERKQEIKRVLRETLSKFFDLKQEEKHCIITDLDERLRKLRERVNRRRENKEKIVDRRLNQIISNAEDLGWE